MQAIFRPNAVGNYTSTDWALTGAATKAIAVGDEMDSSYLLAEIATGGASSARISFLLASTLLALSAVNSVTAYLRAYLAADELQRACVYFPFFRLGGVDVDGAAIIGSPGGSLGTQGVVIARPGGGSWTAADFATLELGFYARRDGDAPEPVVADGWVVVDYTPSAQSAGNPLLLVL